LSSTCFEQPRIHPQEDLYVQFYDISFMQPYKQSGRWQDVFGNYCPLWRVTVCSCGNLLLPWRYRQHFVPARDQTPRRHTTLQ